MCFCRTRAWKRPGMGKIRLSVSLSIAASALIWGLTAVAVAGEKAGTSGASLASAQNRPARAQPLPPAAGAKDADTTRLPAAGSQRPLRPASADQPKLQRPTAPKQE